jgi:hypothetical protein
MIKETVNETRFIDAFKQWDTYKNNFSYHGLRALYEHLEQLSEDMGEDIELDVVAICCDYSEHDSPLQCALQYNGFTPSDAQSLKDGQQYALEWLQNQTQVIEVEGRDYSNGITGAPLVKSIIIQNF